VALPGLLSSGSLVDRLLAAKISNPFRRQTDFLVLDIGSSSVKLAEVHHGAGAPRVRALGIGPLPPTVIQSNVIQEPEPVVEAIRKLTAANRTRATQVITAVPGPAVIVKKVVLDAQAATAVEGAVLAEAGHLIPDSLENVNLDYQVVDWLEDGQKMEVLVVAVKKEIINSYTDTIRVAGLEPVLVDVDYFALENMFESNYDTSDEHPVALVNVGARYSSINIIKGGRSTFTGDVPVGGVEYTDALARQLSVSPEQANTLARGRQVAGLDATVVGPILGSVTEFLVEEIQRALSFFWTAATDEPLGGVVLSGGPARVPSMATQLTQRLGCGVQVADPFRRLHVDRAADRALIEESGPSLAVVAGLVTRQPGDK